MKAAKRLRSIVFPLGMFLAAAGPVAAAQYYVNDGATAGDVYCTAAGNPTNDGLSAATPKDSLQDILDSYDLEPGDVVYVDTGSYSLDNAVSIGASDAGATGTYVTIMGSTNYAAGGSVLDRGLPYSSSSTADVIILNSAVFVKLSDLRVQNGRYGVYAYNADNTLLEYVSVLSNYAGFASYSSVSVRMERCTAAWNQRAVLFTIAGANSAGEWDRCVAWSNDTVFSFESATTFTTSNSVIVAGDLFDNAIADGGDYVVFYDISSWGGGYYALSELQQGEGDWWHSTYADPAFADPAGLDFHPKSLAGRYDPSAGNWVTDAEHSVLIDLGDPARGWTNEPAPNGSRMNVGLYGDSWQASRSRANAWLCALTFNDGGTITGTGTVYWAWGGFTNGATLRLDYSPDDGATWTNIASGLPVTNGEYVWDTTAVTSSPRAFWRIVSEADTNVFDSNDHRFVVRNAAFHFFVNDADTNGDVYCTAAGADTNTGLSAGTPLDSLQAVLDSYDLAGGDVIYIDTGRYALDDTVTWGAQDGADASNPIVVEGSTNGAVGGSVFDRGLPYSGSSTADVIYLSRADYLTFRNLTLASGRYGINNNRGDGLILEGVSIVSNSFGITGYNCSSNRALRCLLAYNTTAIRPGYGGGWGDWDFSRCVFWSNTTALAVANMDTVIVSNSVVLGGTAFSGQPPDSGDFNLFWNISMGVGYNNLAELQKDRDDWWHCTYADPAFADPGQNDFHPQSVMGRYDADTGTWVTDTVHSVLIDFGSPAMPYTNEPAPNGSRMNIGLYGDSWQASKSRTNAWLLALSYNDGGTLSVPSDKVYWDFGNVASDATVRIEYSANSGTNWSIVATNIAVTAGSYTWADTNYNSSRFARWRVVLESDTNVADANDSDFTFRNGPFIYYVNDTNLSGDVYCTAAGDDANLGTTPEAPKASLQSVLDTHDLEPGDIIYIDTGQYDLSANPTITSLDAGDSNDYVHVLGSTNVVDGGTVFNRRSSSSGAYGLYINGADYVHISDLTLRNAGSGVYIYNSSHTLLENICARDNYYYGLYARNSSTIDVRRSVFRVNSRDGIYDEGSAGIKLDHCVAWMNTRNGLRVDSGWVTVSNSVIGASGRSAACYHSATTTNILGDYNDLYIADDAVVGTVSGLGRNLDTLAAWSGTSGYERHSIGAPPLFADPDNGDFHLQSEGGRRLDGGGWTVDTATSLLIDSGDPAQPVADEEAPNGARVNIGLYGGTEAASKSRTNAWLYAAIPSQGGWLKGTGAFHWVAGGAATGHVVRIEYSPDGGQTWSVLTDGVAAAQEVFWWDTTMTNDTPAGLWRITSTNDTSVSDEITNFFAVRNAPLDVFVNDATTTGDVYCTAAGSPSNWTATAAAPLDNPQRALQVYDLEPGDTLYIDSGTYGGTNVVVDRRQSGSTGAWVNIVGSTSEVAATVIDRADTNSGAYAWILDGVQQVALSNLVIRGGNQGLRVMYAGRVNIGRLESVSNAYHGLYLYRSTNVVFHRAVLKDNGSRGLYAQYPSAVQFLRAIVWSNAAGAIYQQSGDLTVEHCVFTATGSGHYIYDISSDADLTSDYNDVLIEDAGRAAKKGSTTYATLARWQQVSSNDLRSLSHTPLFADAAAGDFHPRSEMGRYVCGSGWTNDTETSPLIDSGDPTAAYADESAPNGARVNIGYYGNDVEASRSRTNAWLMALTLNDGGSIRGTNNIYWVAGGAATSHQVRIEFSRDGGLTWTNVVASNLNASAGVYTWNTVPYGSTALGRWRVVSQTDTNIYDQTDSTFILNNGALTYYVNDASTNGDVYCTAVGAALNDGVTPSTPKDSVAAGGLRPAAGGSGAGGHGHVSAHERHRHRGI